MDLVEDRLSHPQSPVARAWSPAGYAWRPVSAAAALAVILLGVSASGYGYHRDELYFRMLAAHPAWGYVDEPPMTPMLARASMAVFGDSLWALRLPAILSLVITVFLVAALARELGGGRFAQGFAAFGVVAPFPLIAGHVLLTASPDMVFWALALLFFLRALLRDEPRWWLWGGLVTGVSLYNKQLIVLLLLGLLFGLLIGGPRRVFARWQLWAGVVIAVVIALPTVIWQASNHWPELTMAGAISDHKGDEDRVMYLPFQIILLGPMVYVWIRGLVAMFRDAAWRPVRALAWAYPVVSVIVLVTGGQIYYTFGLLALYLAAGTTVIGRRRLAAASGSDAPAESDAPAGPDAPAESDAATRTWRWRDAVAVTCTIVIGALVALPVVPVSRLRDTGIGALNQTARDQVGWPAYVREVGEAYQSLPEATRTVTVLVAGNYGEAGALDKYGDAYGLPRVYSGQNQLYYYGPPPESALDMLFVGLDPGDTLPGFAMCVPLDTLDDEVALDNEEQGRQIVLCRGRAEPWSTLWSEFQHYD